MSEFQLGSRLETAYAGGGSLEYSLGNAYQEATLPIY
ncbi:hypothetical protein SAMN04488168_10992 [Bacillus sp. 491mf]|nr:hypothetical protein SAMN04488168_10992 [Bacillus sp. 491mf]